MTPLCPSESWWTRRAVEHPGHDLHVAVRVRLEAAARRDDVVVVDEQQPEVGVRRVVVVPERERVARLQPVDVGGEPLVRPAAAPRRSSSRAPPRAPRPRVHQRLHAAPAPPTAVRIPSHTPLARRPASPRRSQNGTVASDVTNAATDSDARAADGRDAPPQAGEPEPSRRATSDVRAGDAPSRAACGPNRLPVSTSTGPRRAGRRPQYAAPAGQSIRASATTQRQRRPAPREQRAHRAGVADPAPGARRRAAR